MSCELLRKSRLFSFWIFPICVSTIIHGPITHTWLPLHGGLICLFSPLNVMLGEGRGATSRLIYPRVAPWPAYHIMHGERDAFAVFGIGFPVLLMKMRCYSPSFSLCKPPIPLSIFLSLLPLSLFLQYQLWCSNEKLIMAAITHQRGLQESCPSKHEHPLSILFY